MPHTEILRRLSETAIERDRGQWAWLSLFYFDELCPPNAKGERKPRLNAPETKI